MGSNPTLSAIFCPGPRMNRRQLLATVALAAAAAPLRAQGARSPRPLTLLVAHGAWSAGWSWKKMHPLMAAAGHRLLTPTYTGLGEREHLANLSVDRAIDVFHGSGKLALSMAWMRWVNSVPEVVTDTMRR